MALLFGCDLTGVLTLVVLASGCVYLYVRHLYSYWERRGVKYLPPTFPFGNYGRGFLQKTSLGELGEEFYRSTTDAFIGVFGVFRPTLVLRDPELIRNVLIRDFQYFVDRGIYADEKKDPLSAHLFSMNGERWKNMRTKLSPTFTSGKLKAMFSTLVECGAPLQSLMDRSVKKGDTLELREVSARYATNVIASVAFGLDINCIDNPDNAFRNYGRKFFENTLKNGLRFLLVFVFPKLMHLLRIRLVDRDIEEFMVSMVKQTMDYREMNNVVRKDFFQMLVQLRNTGTIQLDDKWETVITNDEKGKKMTIGEVTAQAFVFFVAGFETTSTTMSYCVYEIAKNQDIRQKIQAEIDMVLAKHDGKITYESASEMKYLECCIDETLRKYPPLPFLNRVCTKEYTIPGTNVTIEKGTALLIPIYGLQNDEQFYPNPSKFDPERFSDENRAGKTFVTMPYMPFGEGPRVCIGLRMGKMQTKVGLILMLQQFNFELGKPHIGKDLAFSPSSFILTPTAGIELKVSARNAQAKHEEVN